MSTIPLNDPVLGQALARGRFITLEGGEGAGKSTQVQRIIAHLKAKGLDAMATREPGGSPGAEAMREVLLSGKIKPLGPSAEALAFYAARLDHIEKTIRPALERRIWVICDRFSDSTRAYQGASHQVDERLLKALDRVIVADMKPDLTFILDLPPEIGMARAHARRGAQETDRFEGEDLTFHHALRARFLDIAAQEPQRCFVVDATQNPDDVSAALCDLIDLRLELGFA